MAKINVYQDLLRPEVSLLGVTNMPFKNRMHTYPGIQLSSLNIILSQQKQKNDHYSVNWSSTTGGFHNL